jgi:voltage-gated potassium channel
LDPMNEEKKQKEQTRWNALARLESWMETPLIILGFVWVALIIVEAVGGLSRPLSVLVNVIWVIFIADFLIRLFLAPDKRGYMRRNWITAVSLALPVLRVLRLTRLVRLGRAVRIGKGLRLMRYFGSMNRGIGTVGRLVRRRGIGYMVGITLILVFAGAAVMYVFERDSPAREGFLSYGDALWWAAMIMTTMGSQYWPATTEGRIVCIFLSFYAFSIFGFFTANFASYLVGKERGGRTDPAARELAALRDEIARLNQKLNG